MIKTGSAGKKEPGADARFAVLKQYWGYTSFYPLQEETIDSILACRDSVTMLPTGGGKSLCFQLPALMKSGMAVVISPLISLMKDQVDSLRDMGIDAAYLNSTLMPGEQRAVIKRITNGTIRLLYLSPERLQDAETLALLQSVQLSFFVIDEAHCISHWGHDFRAAYRHLTLIKEQFGAISVHAFTATATEAVQQDIVLQLKLSSPELHIGSVDRPNLTYRVFQRTGLMQQIPDILERHRGQPGIIYCLRKKDVDTLSDKLNALGYRNLPYHAGLTDEMRHDHQEQFMQESVDIIVATIAFGMGIDRSNIRFVIHAAMPKSIEHYQQETGRAGRDGLPSFCYLLYGGGDFGVLSSFITDAANQQEMMEKLQQMYTFCAQPQCRHKVLVNYFSQEYAATGCNACDYCLDELEMVDDALILSQKILSCVVRVNHGKTYGFGAGHITAVLMGTMNEKIASLRHDELSTFGLLRDRTVAFIRYMIEQLLGQGFIRRDAEYGSLFLTPAGQEVLRGTVTPRLAAPLLARKKKENAKKRRVRDLASWEGVDGGLFAALRDLRTRLAREKGVPPYIIFGDKSLKDMASRKPVTEAAFAETFGVGDSKLAAYGDVFLSVIREYAG